MDASISIVPRQENNYPLYGRELLRYYKTSIHINWFMHSHLYRFFPLCVRGVTVAVSDNCYEIRVALAPATTFTRFQIDTSLLE